MPTSDTDKIELSEGASENVEFASQEGEELVDLDALFDALNLVATVNADSLSFSDATGNQGGILTVSNEALASVGVASSLDDVNTVSADAMNDTVISDES